MDESNASENQFLSKSIFNKQIKQSIKQQQSNQPFKKILLTEIQKEIINSISRPQNQNNDIIYQIEKQKISQKKYINPTQQKNNKLFKSKSSAVFNSSFKQNQINFHLEQPMKNISRSRTILSKKSAEIIFKDRYNEYQKQISQNIDKLSNLCQQYFGGLEHNKIQLDKSQLTSDQLNSYYAKVLPKSFNLPKIQTKSNQKQQYLQNHIDLMKNKRQFKSISAKQSLFILDQKNQKKNSKKNDDIIKKVLKNKQMDISTRQITNLINEVRKKYKREPFFCKNIRFT